MAYCGRQCHPRRWRRCNAYELPSPYPFIVTAGAIFGGVLTNVDNLISGTGEIGHQTLGGSGVGTFINEAKGIIDADASGPLVIAGVGPDTNDGLIEATQAGTLLIQNVTINNFLNTRNGTVEAGQNSTVGLENATIVGGLVKALPGSTIEAEQGSNTIAGADVTNAGSIGAEGANLTIIGDVDNHKGDLDANNATLVIDGAVRAASYDRRNRRNRIRRPLFGRRDVATQMPTLFSNLTVPRRSRARSLG